MRVRLAGLPLLAFFGGCSLLIMALVAVVLQGVLRTMIESRAVQDAVCGSAFVTRVALESGVGCRGDAVTQESSRRGRLERRRTSRSAPQADGGT